MTTYINYIPKLTQNLENNCVLKTCFKSKNYMLIAHSSLNYYLKNCHCYYSKLWFFFQTNNMFNLRKNI